MRSSAVLAAFVLAPFVLGCAQAGQDEDPIGSGTPDAAVAGPDASDLEFPDAATGGVPDARIGGAPDAPVGSTPDAASSGTDAGGGPVCSSQADCPNPDECCLSLGGPGFCVPGTEAAGICIPDSQ